MHPFAAAAGPTSFQCRIFSASHKRFSKKRDGAEGKMPTARRKSRAPGKVTLSHRLRQQPLPPRQATSRKHRHHRSFTL